MNTLSPADLRQLMTSTGQWALFDVREAGEADHGHIHGASFLPRRMVELRLPELVPDKGTTIVFYDEGGTRAGLAAHAAQAAGYRDARILRGGTEAWQADGGVLSHGSNVPSKLFGENVFEHEGVPQLPAAILHQWQSDGRPHRVCDIRTPDEYHVGHIPGAWGAFGVDLGLSAADLEREHVPVVVHCAGRTRSIIACQTLREMGVPEVYALENGTMGWMLAGYELESDTDDRVLTPSAASAADGSRRAREFGQRLGASLIDAAQLREWSAQRDQGTLNLYLFDVRQVAAYVAGHVPGARTLPGGLAIQRTDEFIAVRNARIVLVDDGEGRAWITAYWLRRMGFPHLHVLAGGLDQWRANGGIIEKGRPRPIPLRLAELRQQVARVAPTQLRDELASARKPAVIDVDTSKYFAEGHVPGAHWVPYGWLEARIAGIVPDPGAAIVVACHNGIHSTYAAANLAAAGYTNVRVLDGGVTQWTKAGLPVEQGLDDPAPNDIVVPPYSSDRATMARYLEWEQKLTRDHAPSH